MTGQALREARRSVELDPLSMSAYNNLGAMYAYAGQPQRSVEAFEAALALSPEAASVASNLALSYMDVGREADAIRLAESAQAIDPQDHFTMSVLGYIYARVGKRAEAEGALATLRAQRDVSPYLIATVYAGMGDGERAFQWLEEAVDKRDDSVPDLGVDPVFADLRGDPRMQRLLRRIGLD